MLHLRVTGDLPGLARVQVPVSSGCLLVPDLRRGFADEQVGAVCDPHQSKARSAITIEAAVSGVGNSFVVCGDAEGESICLIIVMRDRHGFDPAIRRIVQPAGVHAPLFPGHVAQYEPGERQALLAFTFEVEGVEERDVSDDVSGCEHVEVWEGCLVVPAEAGLAHFVAQASLQETLQAAVVRVCVTDGQVPDLVRLLADPPEPLGDARRDVEQQMLVAVVPADEEARVGALGLAIHGGEAGSRTEDVDLHLGLLETSINGLLMTGDNSNFGHKSQ